MRSLTLLPILVAMVVAPGCVSHRDEPIRVVTVQPAPVVVETRPSVAVPQALPPSPTATTAAPPIDGGRYRVDDVDLIYVQPMNAYTVVGRDDYYYMDGRFYRYDRGRWEYSPHMRDGHWVTIHERDVPDTLVIRYRR